MAGISSTTGLISGLNIQQIVTALVQNDQNVINTLGSQQKSLQAQQAGLQTVTASLLSITTSITQLNTAANYSKYKANNSDPAQLTTTIQSNAAPGDYQFQVLRLASNQQLITRGYADSDTQSIGSGTVTIAKGGKVTTETSLDLLNGGNGVHRGTIRITDRSGVSKDVDLTSAVTVNDVVSTINSTDGIGVKAVAQGDQFILTDLSGGVGSLTVTDRNGGTAAADLGIAKSVNSSTLSGNSVFQVTSNFTLEKLNDGNKPLLADGQPDLRIQLTDVAATILDVDLGSARTLNDVISKINSATGNDGKLTASLANGKLVLTDNTGGGGASPLTVSNLNNSNVRGLLGLDGTAVGNVLNGKSLSAGLNSVLLRNLNGGSGITTPGQISLTDRTGRSGVIDLTAANSLDEVLQAINTAQDGLGNALQLKAEVNSQGTGITVTDTSGSTASNLVIADLGGGTTATDLKIAVNSAQTSVASGSLNRRYVNESASLSSYRNGDAVRRGSISITDSTGFEFSVEIPEAARTVGDVIKRINDASSGRVTAQLNRTGDGFELVDQAGGAGQLQVKELGGTTAADLRLLGTGTAGGDGKSFINSRAAVVIQLESTDTLAGLATKINSAGGGVTASVTDDGSSLTPKRLLLSSSVSGAAGNLIIDDGGLGLGLIERSSGQDALLRSGTGRDGISSFLRTSASNHFDNVAPGLAVDAVTVGTAPANVSVVQDTGVITDSVKSFVNGYNDLLSRIATLTKFDSTTGDRGALQGNGTVLRLRSALSDIITSRAFGGADNPLRSLQSLGVTMGTDGKLSVDSFKLSIAVLTNPSGTKKFFSDTSNGFAAKLKSTLDSYTDSISGKLTAATTNLKTSVDSTQQRIESLTVLLQQRQTTLLNKFYSMEVALSKLNSQQSALSKLQNLSSSSSSSG